MYTYMKIVVLLNLIGIAMWYDSFCLKDKYPTQLTCFSDIQHLISLPSDSFMTNKHLIRLIRVAGLSPPTLASGNSSGK